MRTVCGCVCETGPAHQLSDEDYADDLCTSAIDAFEALPVGCRVGFGVEL